MRELIGELRELPAVGQSIATIVMLLLLATTTPAVAGDGNAGTARAHVCEKAVSTYDMRECLTKALDEANAELEKNSAAVTARMSADERKLFEAASTKWRAYRDASCESVRSLVEGGTMEPVMQLHCLEATTHRRAREIPQLYHPIFPSQ